MQAVIHIEEKIHNLPPFLLPELNDFIDFLFEKKVIRKSKKLKQDWAGSLKYFRRKYSSIELQKLALQWRSS